MGKRMPKSRRIDVNRYQKQVRGSAYYAERVKQKLKKPGEKQRLRSSIKKIVRKESLWQGLSRNFSFYNHCFEAGFGRDILTTLQSIPRNKKESLVIVEDGAANGSVLSKLKERLTALGIPTKTIALALTSQPKIRKRMLEGAIDELCVGPSELFVPKEPVGAVISSFGSVHYASETLIKDHILKFAYSLKKGGIMLAVFGSSTTSFWGMSTKKAKQISSASGKIMKRAGTFSASSSGLLDLIELRDGRINLPRKIQSIKATLKKRGFEALLSNIGSKQYVLSIRRTNIPSKKRKPTQ